MITQTVLMKEQAWPALPLADWQDTCDTLHMWTQVVGKVRLAQSPHLNHWWEVPLYVCPRGLTTSSIPYGEEAFEIRFDFIDHKLDIETSWGQTATMHLSAMSVADFYAQFMGMMRSLGIQTKIWPMPVEVPDPIRFDQDRTHASYDAQYAHRFWRILLAVDMVLQEFRARFIGKSSPVHFFWGSFDLAASRFSGRRAPERPGANFVTKEAYSHEDMSVGFWPGSGNIKGAAFYAYCAPEPEGFAQSPVTPAQAFYSAELHEFVLMYDDVRQAESPRQALVEFFQSTYEAAATLAKWDREALERH